MFRDEWPMAALFAFLVSALIGLVFLSAKYSAQEQAQWVEFAKQQNCRIVERKQAQTASGIGVGFNSSGGTTVMPVSATTPAQAAWLCDDGVTYWREDR